ncbi:TetR/AcrR family transcriptional regulator C-terminal domain-containing protein [Streptomyces sp. NPDC058008]|uniref:TetR/AcrR family transcriptional regulator n=1 Tax=Streptomyces sp. NPDC058008 TaxID=3346303 RepID=UPI0036E038F6
MTKALDPRSRRSRRALQEALLTLLADQELGEITVSRVTRRAGTSRSTFYDHYTDVHELAAEACTAQFDELLAAAPVFAGRPAPDGQGRTNPLSQLFTHVAAHARLYDALLGPEGSARVINHLHHRIAIAFFVNRSAPADPDRTHATDPDEIPLDPAAAFHAGALIGVVMDWLRRGCPRGPDEMAEAVWPLVRAAGRESSDGREEPSPRYVD